MSSSNDAMPSTFVVARAGAELGARLRSFASSVLETVIAAVPAKPATRPFPMLLANVLATFMTPPPARGWHSAQLWLAPRPSHRAAPGGGRRPSGRLPLPSALG